MSRVSHGIEEGQVLLELQGVERLVFGSDLLSRVGDFALLNINLLHESFRFVRHSLQLLVGENKIGEG